MIYLVVEGVLGDRLCKEVSCEDADFKVELESLGVLAVGCNRPTPHMSHTSHTHTVASSLTRGHCC